MSNPTSTPDPTPSPTPTPTPWQEKRIYAPMSNMGDLTYDADAVYINIPDAAVSSR